MNTTTSALTDRDFERLLEFRDGLRHFLRWSEDQAKATGLTAAQHQLLLAVRGHGSPPSISDVAHHLLLRHHSVVELVNRAAAAGLVERFGDPDDERVARLRLTRLGERKLASLTAVHVEEISLLRICIDSLWKSVPEH